MLEDFFNRLMYHDLDCFRMRRQTYSAEARDQTNDERTLVVVMIAVETRKAQQVV